MKSFFIFMLFSFSIFCADNFPVPDILSLEKLLNQDTSEQIFVKSRYKANKKLIKKTSGYTPKKNTQNLISLDSPIKKKLSFKARLVKDGISTDCKIVNSATKNFNRQISLVDPLFASETMIIEQNSEYWDNFIETNLLNITDLFVNEEYFIECIINVINKNIEILMQHVKTNDNKEFVCRHFSFVALPIISKILHHPQSPYKGTVQVFSADFYDSQWKRVSNGGHCWNILCFERDNKKYIFYVDIPNEIYAELSGIKIPNDIVIIDIRLNDVSFLNKDNIFEPYIVFSLKKLNLISAKSIEDDKEASEIAIEKILNNVKIKNIYEINL
jgi:hypothetical protein